VAFVTIEALNLWASFVRSFYISCVLRARTATGARITITRPGLHTTGDAITFCMHQMKHRKGSGPWLRRQEPAWHDTSTVLNLLTAIGASNLTQVQNALSYPTSFPTMLPLARHFFAHRNQDTMHDVQSIARNLGVSARLRPSDVLCSRAAGRPQNVLSDWLDDIRNVVDLMCQ